MVDSAPMPQRNATGVEVRVYQVVFGILCIGLFFVALQSLMRGSFKQAGVVVSLIFGFAMVFALDRRYWIACPFLGLSGLSIRGLPFNGLELGCLAVTSVYFVRLGLHKERTVEFNRDVLVVFPMFLWMMFVFCLNPVGMAMFGTETIGGRFYFEVVIGFFAFLALSTIRVREEDAKFLFFALLTALSCSLARGVIFPGVDPDAVVFTGSEPERSQRYAFVVCAVIYTLLFSRYSLSDILRSPFKVVLFAALALLTVYSGKRRSVGTLVLVPVFRTLLTGRERLLVCVMAVVAAFVLGAAVVGDGGAYRLPRSARRALAVVVPRYRRSMDDGGMKDYFREMMRQQARHVISRNPWLGRKGFAMNLSETSWLLFGGGRTSLYAGHAYSGNWHSAWYAYAADFGLPCMFLWAVFVIHLIRFAWRTGRTVDSRTWLGVCCLFFAIQLLVDLVFSYTSGHSAVTSMTEWTRYGLLVALFRSYSDSRGYAA